MTTTSKSLAAVVGGVLLLASGCGASSSGGGAPVTDNPRSGWVKIDDTTWKICDGKRILYEYDTGNVGGITVVDNAPECGGTPTPVSTP